MEGPVWTLELDRGPAGFSLESDMSFDLLMMRHRRFVAETVRKFGADLIHITGPSDVGILGAYPGPRSSWLAACRFMAHQPSRIRREKARQNAAVLAAPAA